MNLVAYTDGASRGNPGEAGVGIIIKDEQGTVKETLKKYLGKTTNNVAEYTALIILLEFLKNSQTLKCSQLGVFTDSELMERQLNGKYKVKDSHLKLLFQKVKLLIDSASFKFSIRHIPRSMNSEADALANEAIDSRTI